MSNCYPHPHPLVVVDVLSDLWDESALLRDGLDTSKRCRISSSSSSFVRCLSKKLPSITSNKGARRTSNRQPTWKLVSRDEMLSASNGKH